MEIAVCRDRDRCGDRMASGDLARVEIGTKTRGTAIMAARLLSQAEYEATLAAPTMNIRNDGGPFVDVEPYLKEVPSADWRGHEMRSAIPDYVYLSPDKRYEHYLIPTTTADIYMVIVADNVWQGFFGHRLLNLNDLYGLKSRVETKS